MTDIEQAVADGTVVRTEDAGAAVYRAVEAERERLRQLHYVMHHHLGDTLPMAECRTCDLLAEYHADDPREEDEVNEPKTPTGKRTWKRINGRDAEHIGNREWRHILPTIEREAAAAVRAELMDAIDANLQTGGLDRHAHAIFYCMLTSEDNVLADHEATDD